MSIPRERLQQQTQQTARATLAGARQAGADAEVQADALQDRALEAQAEQAALLEASPLESQYGAAFAAQVEAKHDQAERIEDRLEDLIERQESRMQQAQAKQPGMLALPSTRAKWQQQMQQQQATLQRLHGRLETVREIKEGMGIHSPRIEELAARKLRAQEPELASEWADMREAQRRHEALQRKEEQEKKQTQDRERREQIERTGRGVRLGLSQAR
uniref:KfrC stable inheritance protein n=2 Tax=Bacteria TaxID=2 RepID=D4N5L1_9BACT|nr:KfrC stable inheritance protein [uncultured bacterium pAKD4]